MTELENLMPAVAIALFAAVALFVGYRFFRYGGLIGLFYGSRHREIGTVEFSSRLGKTKAILHVLESGALGQRGDLVLEMRSRMGTSIQSMPYRMTRETAKELCDLLQRGLNE